MERSIKLDRPVFTISLDFELMWGVFDKRTIDSYGENIRGVHQLIPKLLELFHKYNVHVTWATVGMLFNETLEELKNTKPEEFPSYANPNFSAYNQFSHIRREDYSLYYSAVSLIQLINSYKHQEIGTHTYSHYYCLEQGQSISQFKADLKLAISKAQKMGLNLRSIVFPRNQYNNEYLNVCAELGIASFRGNESNILQKPRNQDQLNIVVKVLRYLDSYFNITGHNIYQRLESKSNLLNIPASFFFRPYNPKLPLLERLKVRRIKSSMLTAAKQKSLFHLWWHPHNFGKNQNENLMQLEEVLKYYVKMQSEFGMESMNMSEIIYINK